MSQQLEAPNNSSQTSFESTVTEKELEVLNNGDNIQERLPKESPVEGPGFVTAFDTNMVTWDGPNDPSNPQNWSTKYKWFTTVVPIIMSINV